MWRNVKVKAAAIRAFLQARKMEQDKGVFRASTDSPKHTARQRRAGIFRGVTFFISCYRLYSKAPDFADLKRFFLNTRSVTERKGEKWTTTQKE